MKHTPEELKNIIVEISLEKIKLKAEIEEIRLEKERYYRWWIDANSELNNLKKLEVELKNEEK